ncbi:hypothetical protein V2J09_011093 [Rumex salicifolius]
MGKASRWLKSWLGMKKDKQTPSDQNDRRKDRRRWSFTHSRTDSVPPPRRMSLNIVPAGDAAWRRNHFSDKDDDEAIAAATAAAAEAAVAAAQAEMAVVRLTTSAGAARERWAAVKIQNVFRGYLARKALRALKGLVKLQAHVRGYLVRKRAADTLHSMQALIRAQATARFLRFARPSEDESRSEYHSKMMSDCCYEDTPKIVEIDTYKPRSVRPNNNNNINHPFASGYGDHYTCPFSMSGPIGGPYLTPARLSVPSRRYECGPCDNSDRQFRRMSTAQSTPRYSDWATEAKPVWDEGAFRTYQLRQPHPPNYMASTHSFAAKSTRSQSTPKQRINQPSPSKKKKMPLEKLMECRHSLSGVRMNRSYSEDVLHF